MKIALYGIAGLYNFGCEAIVRGTVALIRQVEPNADIYYYSPRANEDRDKIYDLDISVVQVTDKVTFFSRVINKLFRVFLIPYQVNQKSNSTITKECDCVIRFIAV